MAHETSESGEQRKECIQCSRCLEVCPLVRSLRREELGPKAKHLLETAMRDGSLDENDAAALASLCLGCTRCEDVCSQGLSGARAVSRMRAAHPGWRQWLWKQWMGPGKLFWPLARGLSRVLPSDGPMARIKGMRSHGISPFMHMQACSGIGMEAREVALFGGCTAGRLEGGWNESARALLGQAGARLKDVDFSCCGATLIHAGLTREGLESARSNLKAWDRAGRPMVATLCASCHAGLLEYAHLKRLDPELANAFAGSLQPVSAWLHACQWGVDASHPRVLFHRPCHDRNGKDLELLQTILGQELHTPDMPGCCGMGGVMQLAEPDMAAAVSGTCWEIMAARSGDLVLTGCSGCVLTLRATAPEGVSVAHWLDAILPG